MKLRNFCCYYDIKTGRRKGQCVKCGDCLFNQRLDWESTENLARDADSATAQANLGLGLAVPGVEEEFGLQMGRKGGSNKEWRNIVGRHLVVLNYRNQDVMIPPIPPNKWQL